MSFRKSLLDAFRRSLGRLSGTPIEFELSPYEAIAREARRLGAAGGASMAACLGQAAEACGRTLALEPFDAQLVAAAAICSGKVAQMQTGEGKTLAAAMAACYCARRDGCVHVVTANDYLARRDARWTRPVYEALGLSAASVAGGDSADERRAAYRADVVYLTAKELGFDYLRDGLAYSPDELVQRGFASAIVDEADFILIDEARVPLVIAGPDASPGAADGAAGEAARDAVAADLLARALRRGLDFEADPEGRRVSLTLAGQARVEDYFGRGGIHTAEGAPFFARAHAALHAHNLLSRDVDYLVKDGRVRLVDAFTGRVVEKRQWPWGIHAALEAKEGLEIRAEGRIYGSIAIQHLIGLYPRLAAMTATAESAAGEFAAAYGMGTVVVPPTRPSRRRDEADAVFPDRASMLRAIVAETVREHGRGRSVLVGCSSVLESEELAADLAGAGVDCVVLNAKNDEEEAALIAAAGRRGAVTVSTNMAGRGVDIRLGEGPEVLELGGLCVIGVGRRESRRIDDQLRGRAGRQGDPGSSRFFLSLEDPLFESYGVRAFLPARFSEAAAGREIARAQAILEGRNSDIRRSLRKYSLLVEYDRRYVRRLRDEALLSHRLPEAVEAAAAAVPGGESGAARGAMALSFISRLDAAWADYLALVEDVKEGMRLFRYGGKDPGMEYVRIVGDAFEAAMRELVEVAVGDCLAILEGRGSGGFAGDLPPRPSSTWTYSAAEDEVSGFREGLESLFRAR